MKSSFAAPSLREGVAVALFDLGRIGVMSTSLPVAGRSVADVVVETEGRGGAGGGGIWVGVWVDAHTSLMAEVKLTF
jgi:hypothetical protein